MYIHLLYRRNLGIKLYLFGFGWLLVCSFHLDRASLIVAAFAILQLQSSLWVLGVFVVVFVFATKLDLFASHTQTPLLLSS